MLARSPRHRKRRGIAAPAPPPPPPLANEIVSVSLRGDGLAYVVEVGAPLAGFTLVPDTWFFTVDGGEEVPVSAGLLDAHRVQLVMGFDVAGTTAWAVADGGGFAFADGQPLVGPGGGGFPFP